MDFDFGGFGNTAGMPGMGQLDQLASNFNPFPVLQQMMTQGGTPGMMQGAWDWMSPGAPGGGQGPLAQLSEQVSFNAPPAVAAQAPLDPTASPAAPPIPQQPGYNQLDPSTYGGGGLMPQTPGPGGVPLTKEQIAVLQAMMPKPVTPHWGPPVAPGARSPQVAMQNVAQPLRGAGSLTPMPSLAQILAGR